MTDPKTAADLEAQATLDHQAKEQAEYDAKPACERCGHHPGDALHVCGKPDATPDASAPTIAAPGGVLTAQEYEAAFEVEGLPPPNKQDLIAKVNEWMPNATPAEKVEEAKRLIGRWMLMDIAFKAGRRQGRDLRQRAEHGKGWWMPELEELTPHERTFVLGKLWDEIMPPQAKKPEAFGKDRRMKA